MKTSLTLFTMLVAALSFTASAQVGNTFPYLEGESLTKTFVNIPEDVKGKHTLIGLAYTKKSEQDLKSWFKPTYETFLKSPEEAGLFDITYDINCYFIPMFSGAKRAAYGKVMKKMKEGLDRKLQPHVLFYKGNIKEYKEALNFQGKDIPYFFVLDPEGKIVYATSGRYTTKKMQEVVNAVEDAMEF